MENKKEHQTEVGNQNAEASSWKQFFSLGEVGGYFFRKKDLNRPANFSLRMMHGVNKLSIIIFLLGVIYLISKHVF